jgi:hypothetical protein
VELLNEKGFVFLDKALTPWLCRMWGNEPWLFRWNNSQKNWVSIKKVTQSEIFTYPHNLTEEEQDLYRNIAEKNLSLIHI